MGLHNSYLIVISVLFAMVFAILLYSLIRHRKPDAHPSRFGGPNGRVQWLWALVPMAILGVVNLALIDYSNDHHNVTNAKIELAAVRK
jgi:cytochrome c oxidase subunit II